MKKYFWYLLISSTRSSVLSISWSFSLLSSATKVSWCYIENDHKIERTEDRVTGLWYFFQFSVPPCTAKNGQKCQFPFTEPVNGVRNTYNSCTKDNSPTGEAWCRTTSGDDYCNSGCPGTGSRPTSRPTQRTTQRPGTYLFWLKYYLITLEKEKNWAIKKMFVSFSTAKPTKTLNKWGFVKIRVCGFVILYFIPPNTLKLLNQFDVRLFKEISWVDLFG